MRITSRPPIEPRVRRRSASKILQRTGFLGCPAPTPSAVRRRVMRLAQTVIANRRPSLSSVLGGLPPREGAGGRPGAALPRRLTGKERAVRRAREAKCSMAYFVGDAQEIVDLSQRPRHSVPGACSARLRALHQHSPPSIWSGVTERAEQGSTFQSVVGSYSGLQGRFEGESLCVGEP